MAYLPDAEDYKLTNLLRRIDDGQKVGEILREMAKINFRALNGDNQEYYKTKFGYRVSKLDRDKLLKAISRANKNIDAAHRKYSEFSDVLPEKFNADKILSEINNEAAYNNRLKGIQMFTPSKLIPTTLDGMSTTQAEYDYLKAILDRENQRRAANNIKEPPEGYLVTQNSYDNKPIDISRIADLETMRRRADQWDDPALVVRANNYLSNYLQSLEGYESQLRLNGMYPKSLDSQFKQIREIIGRITNDVDVITYVATRMPELDISVISGRATGDIGLAAIYHEWQGLRDMLDNGYFSG